MATVLLRLPEVARRYQLAEVTIRRQVKSGRWNHPYPVLVRPYRWREDEIERDLRTASFEHAEAERLRATK